VGAELYLMDGRTDGRADRHDEANSCSVQFCERAQKYVTRTYGVPRLVYPSQDQNVCRPNHGPKSDIDSNSATAQQL
jgi:hypothetical protein